MKQAIRAKYLGYRNSLTWQERTCKSRVIWDNLKQEPLFLKAQVVLAYMDYRSEVMTTGLVEEMLRAENKRVFVPRVEGMDIEFYEIGSLEELSPGYQNIREPEKNADKLFTHEIAEDARVLLLAPGAAFDHERVRMGYGKGFYDRFLARFPHIATAGLGFRCQIAPSLPCEPHDKKMDIIVTENGIIR